jgi:hypothetical protein
VITRITSSTAIATREMIEAGSTYQRRASWRLRRMKMTTETDARSCSVMMPYTPGELTRITSCVSGSSPATPNAITTTIATMLWMRPATHGAPLELVRVKKAGRMPSRDIAKL